jgi:hypothetical protein
VARNFNGTNQKLLATSGAAITGVPATFAAIVRTDTTSLEKSILGVSRSTSSTPLFRIIMSSAGKPSAQFRGTGTTSQATGTTTLSTTAYQQIAGTFASDAATEIFYNGVSEATAAAPTNSSITVNQTEIGVLQRTSAAQFWDGDIAECAMWNAVLDAAEIAALAKGYSPLLIRPANLVAYWPLVGKNSPETDIVGRYDMTVTGATASAHPRIFLPTAQILTFPSTATSGTTVSIPAGSLTLTGYAPTVVTTANQTVAVPAGTLTLTGNNPTVVATDNQTVAVPAGSLSLTGFAPTVTAGNNQTVAVPLGTLTLTGNAPTVVASGNQTISVPAGSLTLTGFNPTVVASDHQTIAVPAGTLVLTGIAPTVTVSGAGAVLIQVPSGTLTLGGHNPTVIATGNITVSIPAGSLSLTGYQPTVLTPRTVQVPAGTLALTGNNPTVVITSNQIISIPTGNLTLTGYAPTVLGTVVTPAPKGGVSTWTESDFQLRKRLRSQALAQANLQDDEEALAILLATLMRR